MKYKINILLVEDSEADADLLLRFLIKEISTFSHLRVWTKDAFIDALNCGEFDIIISDQALPQFSGMEAFRIAKQFNPNIPFILVTGTVSETMLTEFIKEGIDDYIFKENLLRLPSSIRHSISTKKIEYLHHKLELAYKDIKDSINYAERIQRSFLASKELLDEHLNRVRPSSEANREVTAEVSSRYVPQEAGGTTRTDSDYFVFFQPKDVVSGDFYWASSSQSHDKRGGEQKKLFYLCTADSTGHGVPGAIMSLLNIASLEKAIENNNGPADILNQTRKTIIERLKKDGSKEGGKDGMDCSLIVFDFANLKMTYSAANNPVWIIRENKLIQFEANRMPVGKNDRDKIPFTEHDVVLKTNDVVYTLTDGLPDQFGGERGKKFMYKQLKEFLISISGFPMNEQKIKIASTLKNWMGDNEQVDDITLIGVRV